MNAIIDDALLLKIEGSEKYMIKLSEAILLEEREEGREEGRYIFLLNLIDKKKHKNKTREQIIDELELDENEIEILDNFEGKAHLITKT